MTTTERIRAIRERIAGARECVEDAHAEGGLTPAMNSLAYGIERLVETAESLVALVEKECARP